MDNTGVVKHEQRSNPVAPQRSLFFECVIALRLRKADSQLEDALCPFKPQFHSCLCLLTDINCHRQRFTSSLCVRVIFVCVQNSVFSCITVHYFFSVVVIICRKKQQCMFSLNMLWCYYFKHIGITPIIHYFSQSLTPALSTPVFLRGALSIRLCPPLLLRANLSTPTLSTHVVHSRDVHPCFFVPTCPLPRFHPFFIASTTLSIPAISVALYDFVNENRNWEWEVI